MLQNKIHAPLLITCLALTGLVSAVLSFQFGVVALAIGSACVVIAAIVFWKSTNLLANDELLQLSLLLNGGQLSKSKTVPSLQHVTESINRLKSELIESRQHEKAIIERAVDVICVTDINCNFTSVSKACINAWGYAPSELEGSSLLDIVASIDTDKILKTITDSANSIDKIVFECQLKKKSGELIDVVWTGYWSATDRGLFCIVHDITERKRAENMRREFTAMVTHEIRTPLTSISGVLSMLEDGTFGQLSGQGEKMIVRSHQTCKRLLKLINDLLDVEKIEAGRFQVIPKMTSIKRAIDDAIETVETLANEHEIDIEVQSVGGIECWTDEDRITQVLVNFLSNSIKFSPPKSMVRILVEDCADSARISVIDEGKGIPADKLEKVFEQFEQLDFSSGKNNVGSGLGLAICRAIIQGHGGEIGVTSTYGEGSCFWFTLPKRHNHDLS